MLSLNIKANHQAITTYYEKLAELEESGKIHEGAVSQIFAELLGECCHKLKLRFSQQYPYRYNNTFLRFDGVIENDFYLRCGIWEAKDCEDNLEQEIKKKFAVGYPQDNILFQNPDQGMLYQSGKLIVTADLRRPAELIQILKAFLEYMPPEFEEWDQATKDFQIQIPKIATVAMQLIHEQNQKYADVAEAIQEFYRLCQISLNENITESAVLEMIVQHLIIERIFRTVLDNSDFFKRNPIACAVEKVIVALTRHEFSREKFLESLQHFYKKIERTAISISGFQEKQIFLNGIYERFFQGFSKKTADTHGIVYTPHDIVEFMINSVEEILQREFGKKISDPNINIIDPFVGTGNFITHLLDRISDKKKLEHKYLHEIWCNEIMLMAYYIATMNIQQLYYEKAKTYQEFPHICLMDTFQRAEEMPQDQVDFLSEINAERVSEEKSKRFFVILSNPPYNAHQENENDNNKNYQNQVMEHRVQQTYIAQSSATNRNALFDPYVKAFRWAGDQILLGGEGIVAFVSNNSFVHDVCFDGMRKTLQQEFDSIYILDLGGNVRKRVRGNPVHNVFGIRVGVCITLLIRTHHDDTTPKLPGRIFYMRLDEALTKEQKFEYLKQNRHYQGDIQWQELCPNAQNLWITQGLSEEFSTFIPMGTKQAKAKKHDAEMTIFQTYSKGVNTSRDAWVYNFNSQRLTDHVENTISTYNEHVYRYKYKKIKPEDIDHFVSYDDTKIKWSRDLKLDLKRKKLARFDPKKIRKAMYRPFCKQYLYFDRILNEEIYRLPGIFPIPRTEQANRIICVTAIGSTQLFHCLMINSIADVHLTGDSQCFPFYTYNPNNTNRTENITDQTLRAYQEYYHDPTISKWNIFYYIYAVLIHPEYARQYAMNLRYELPRIPFLANFWKFAKAGEQLADLHIHYEEQSEYPLQRVENANAKADYRVKKMRFNQDKTAIIYNDFLTLAGIPSEVYLYRLGARSALEWIVAQYQITLDERSHIVNDPNDPKQPQAIIQLIGKIITVSLETMRILNCLNFI